MKECGGHCIFYFISNEIQYEQAMDIRQRADKQVVEVNSRLEEDRLSYKLYSIVVATLQVVKIVGAKAKNKCKRDHEINCGEKIIVNVVQMWCGCGCPRCDYSHI